MKIESVFIKNFKSIREITLDFTKYDDSYTRFLVGINESGKSNILNALSWLDTPRRKFDYRDWSNQKDEQSSSVEIRFQLSFENPQTYLNPIREFFTKGGEKLNFIFKNIRKIVYIESGRGKVKDSIDYEIVLLNERPLFITKFSDAGKEFLELSETNTDENSAELTEEVVKKHFGDKLTHIIRHYIPATSFWTPLNEYLLSTVDLNNFSSNPDSCKPLKNIFALAGYKKESKIQEIVNAARERTSDRSRLQSRLSDKATRYVNGIWQHRVDLVIEISDSLQLTTYVRDQGQSNKHDRHDMEFRSDGFKQFISLILSLSLDSEHGRIRNSLILIDEPEAHLHPSGIRDLGKELLKIGKDNYLWASTHSPFLIDKKCPGRHVIIKKNKQAITETKCIRENQDLHDDEVLKDAFGINVYRDLLNPHSILVEGATDKVILQKAFQICGMKNVSITNSDGSNIVTIASKLNHDDISLLVLLDDDNPGRKSKEKIINIRGNFSRDNVFTIRDLVGEIQNNGTIEDAMGKEFVSSIFLSMLDSETSTFDLKDDSPYIAQIKRFLQPKRCENVPSFLNEFKTQLSEEFDPPKTRDIFNEKFPLLKKLAEAIREKLTK